MRVLFKAALISLGFLLAPLTSWAASSGIEETEIDSLDHKNNSNPLLAQKKRKKRSSKGRQKHLTSEARNRKGKTNIDFDEASIDGRRRLPAGVAISKTKEDHAYDLIKLRLRWHPEMIQSTSNLETGQGR